MRKQGNSTNLVSNGSWPEFITLINERCKGVVKGDVAALVGITPQDFSKILAGTSNPSLIVAMRLIKALDINPEELISLPGAELNKLTGQLVEITSLSKKMGSKLVTFIEERLTSEEVGQLGLLLDKILSG